MHDGHDDGMKVQPLRSQAVFEADRSLLVGDFLEHPNFHQLAKAISQHGA